MNDTSNKERSRLYLIVMWIIRTLCLRRDVEEFQGLWVNQKIYTQELNRQLFRGFEYGRH